MAVIDSTTLATRFWAKVNKTDTCWLWTGSTSGKGYGKIHITVPGGRRGPDGRSGRRMDFAHRVAWMLEIGEIPDGIELLHNCPGGDNPRCVNPAHLILGTHADNMMDAAVKGQMARGERRPTAKMTDEIVRMIRRRYAVGDVTQQALADEIGVSISQICGAVNGKTWRHVKAGDHQVDDDRHGTR